MLALVECVSTFSRHVEQPSTKKKLPVLLNSFRKQYNLHSFQLRKSINHGLPLQVEYRTADCFHTNWVLFLVVDTRSVGTTVAVGHNYANLLLTQM